MTVYLLKVHQQTFLSLPVTQKCQILSCDTLVANERYVVDLFNFMEIGLLRRVLLLLHNSARFHAGRATKETVWEL
jgi:hypothetical protein